MKLRWLVVVAIGCGSEPQRESKASPGAPAAASATRQPIDPAAVRDAIDGAKRSGSWDAALPILTRAVTAIAEDDPRSVDAATHAADALGEAHAGLDGLAELAHRPTTKPISAAQIAAIRALGKMADRDKAAAALVSLVTRVPPQHPRRARLQDERQRLEEAYALHLGSTGAAIDALAELDAASSVEPVVAAMYRMPDLFGHARRALVAAGTPAEDALRAVLAGRDAQLEHILAREHLDRYCGDRDDRPCVPVSARDFYAAVVLGDFYDRDAVPDLVAALARKPEPAYYLDGAPAPSTQHDAIFDALRRIGAPEPGLALRARWRDSSADLATRTPAAAAYAFVARDAAGTDELCAIAADKRAADTFREEAATSCARLAADVPRMKGMQDLAKRYLDASAKKRAEADRAPKHDAAFHDADIAAKAYLGYARVFQTHIARIAPALRCQRDLACYAQTLTRTPAAAFADVRPYVADAATFTADDKAMLRAAEIERATIELGKRPDEAARFLPQLLDAIAPDRGMELGDRLARQAVLLAIAKVAKPPCAVCRARLDAAIAANHDIVPDVRDEMIVLRARYR